jgi:hypothetical protein
MDLIIQDCPEDKDVQLEILTNAMTTIKNFYERQKKELPKSEAEVAIDAQVSAVVEKNIPKVSIAPKDEPKEEPKEEPKDEPIEQPISEPVEKII